MKAVVCTKRRIVAVLGANGNGIFVRKTNGGILFIDGDKGVEYSSGSLEITATCVPGRTPVYEGDIVTLQF